MGSDDNIWELENHEPLSQVRMTIAMGGKLHADQIDGAPASLNRHRAKNLRRTDPRRRTDFGFRLVAGMR